ncbi:MAG: YcxB family protein [Asticcacaulis sp.]|nr:YcxB family protein [Asticcacaulis sp.]
MSEEPQSVPPYGVGFGNYCTFLWIWLKGFVASRSNLIRFAVYAAAIAAMFLWSWPPIIVDGVEQPRDTTFWATAIGAGLVGGLLFGAMAAYLLAPVLIFLWQAIGYLFGPLRHATSQVTVSPDAVIKDHSSPGTPWNAVHAVTETRNTVLIFTRPNGALIIPKSAFASPDDAQAFYQAAESWWIRANR